MDTDELLFAESRLDRAFVICLVAMGLSLSFFVGIKAFGLAQHEVAELFDQVLTTTLGVACLWHALALRKAANLVGRPGNAILLGVLAIGAWGASSASTMPHLAALWPLPLKLILSRELRSTIHDRTFQG